MNLKTTCTSKLNDTRISKIRYLKRIVRKIYLDEPISTKQYHHWLNLRDGVFEELKMIKSEISKR